MKTSGEIYAQFTLSRINGSLKRAPLSDEQREVIYKALLAEEAHERHSVDLRLYIPLLFRGYYLVLFAGRDRRKSTLELNSLRLRRSMRGVIRLLTIVSTSLLSFLLASALFWSAYKVKTALGIDLIPGFHLTDLFS